MTFVMVLLLWKLHIRAPPIYQIAYIIGCYQPIANISVLYVLILRLLLRPNRMFGLVTLTSVIT